MHSSIAESLKIGDSNIGRRRLFGSSDGLMDLSRKVWLAAKCSRLTTKAGFGPRIAIGPVRERE
jgi:hypothetical protein